MTLVTPITLVTGFLGAGKTTLVNRALSQAEGLRIAVIVNEFGSLNIDGRLIARQRGPVVELLNGCICCATGGDFLRALADLDEQRFDAILIESSGLADPTPIIDQISTSAPSHLRLSAVVTVVDADNYDANLDQAEAAFTQLASADLLIINKIDLVEPGIPERISTAIARINSDAGRVFTTLADVSLDLILGVVRRDPAPAAPHHHHHDGFATVSVTATGALDLDRFRAFVDALPPEVIRAKGFVRLSGRDGLFAFQRVGRRSTIFPADEEAGGAETGLVLIGKRVDSLHLSTRFKDCAA